MNSEDPRRLVREKITLPFLKLLKRFLRWVELVSSDYTNVQAFGLWTAAVITGFVAVAYAQTFHQVEERFSSLVESFPFLTLGLTPLAFLAAWWMVFRFAPGAAGSGIPQVMAAVEIDTTQSHSAFVDRLLSLKTAGIKILSSICCLLGGGAIGREGPTLQISAAIFSWVGNKVRQFYPNSNPQTWVIAGAAAGLASAFNTPLGGIVYAIEELGVAYFHRIRTALLTAVIISGIVAQSIIGSYLYLGYPQLQPFRASLWPLIVLTGFASGLCGALFSRLLVFGLNQRNRLTSPWQQGLFAVFCGGVVASFLFLNPAVSGPGSDVINRILFQGEPATYSLIFQQTAATVFTYLSGAAGGIFSPSLTVGAAIGSKIAFLFGSPNVNLLAMLGMIGFVTGVTHAPFTSFILVLEMSDRHSTIFPMMISALVASGVARSVQKKSFYETVRDRLLEKNSAP